MILDRLLLVVLVGGALASLAMPADAQVSKLDGKFDPATRAAIVGVIDAAVERGMPAELSDKLVSEALYGRVRGLEGVQIVDAVRERARLFEAARHALGPATPVEIESGAAALKAGVRPGTLTALRRARETGSVELPLVVLADFLTRGVPADTAVRLVLEVAGARSDEQVWHQLRLAVVQDISAGKTPVVAASTRTRGVLGAAAGAAAAVTLDEALPGTRGGTKPTAGGTPPPEQ